jgi:hypothetical protein
LLFSGEKAGEIPASFVTAVKRTEGRRRSKRRILSASAHKICVKAAFSRAYFPIVFLSGCRAAAGRRIPAAHQICIVTGQISLTAIQYICKMK